MYVFTFVFWFLFLIFWCFRLCGFTPFYGDDEDEVYDKIEEGDYTFPSPYWDKISDDAKDLIKKCFILNREDRITIDEALSHPWICVCGKIQKLNCS